MKFKKGAIVLVIIPHNFIVLYLQGGGSIV